MDTVRPFVGKHSPRIKLGGSEPRGIQQSKLRLGRSKSYEGRIYLAGDPGAKVVVRLVWGTGAGDSQTVTIPSLSPEYKKFPLKFTAAADTEDARLEILGTGSGTFHVGTASLMPADNVQGFHAGMIRLFKEEGFKMFKWPGGNFVSAYDWRDGLGDRDKRPPRLQPMWSDRVESNDVGFMSSSPSAGWSEPSPIWRSTAGSARRARRPNKWNTAMAPSTRAWARCARRTGIPSLSMFAAGPSATRCMVPGSMGTCRSTSTGSSTTTSSKP